VKRFAIWLVPIVLLLVAIPLLLLNGSSAAAKISGIVVVVLTTLAIRYWMFRSGVQRRHAARVKLTANEQFFLRESLPYYNSMPAPEKRIFTERVGLLLAALDFDRFDHTDAGREESLAFAAMVVLASRDFDLSVWEGRIIVFREGGETGISRQSDRILIFISPAIAVSFLGNYNRNTGSTGLPAQLQAVL
jgi:hypothetical protein